MNTANLQLEGLLMAVATLNTTLVRKGLLTHEELDAALHAAEDQALQDRLNMLSPSAEAIAFPLRLLRIANNASDEGGVPPFSELARMVGTLSDGTLASPGQPTAGANPKFFPDVVPEPMRPDVTQGAITRGATEDRSRETLHNRADERNPQDAARHSASPEGDDQETIAITPAETIAAFGLKS